MPAQFDSMEELLVTIEESLLGNIFLRKWLKKEIGDEPKKGRV